MAEKATQTLATMETRIVTIENMLEVAIKFDGGVGNAHVAKHGLDPLTGNMAKGIAQSHNSRLAKYFSLSLYTRILKSIVTIRKEGF
jgi:hypothetical protein